MAPGIAYDDFRVTFAPRPDGGHELTATLADGTVVGQPFELPWTLDELRVRLARVGDAVATRGTTAGTTRDIGGDEAVVADERELGEAIGQALFGPQLDRAYGGAVEAAARRGRGLRLTLSLAATPELLGVPWEFLYRSPRFVASQRQTPVVRLLDRGGPVAPALVGERVRILGVVASSPAHAPLDVAAERRRVTQAVARVAAAGAVELEWLEPATPRRLREALRDGSFHVLHYIGHSDFRSAEHAGIYLTDDDSRPVLVDPTMLANLLSDQRELRLVVLNSCSGARTAPGDPFSGVATTLIELGVPAVVAMQFAITDVAAIVFAAELYTNLVGRQEPIDVAVAEARKAIYVEVSRTEWATPVLFVRDPDQGLFEFAGDAALAPLPPPRRRRRWILAGAAAGAAVLGIAGVLALRDDGGRPAGGGVLGDWVVALDGDGAPTLRSAGGLDVAGTEPAWSAWTGELAFRGTDDDVCAGLCVVTSDDAEPRVLVAAGDGVAHRPAWSSLGALYFAQTAGCEPGPDCIDTIRLRVGAGDDPVTVPSGTLRGISGLVVDGQSADTPDDVRLAYVDAQGAHLLERGRTTALAEGGDAVALTMTANQHLIVGVPRARAELEAWTHLGEHITTIDVATLLRESARDYPTGLDPDTALPFAATAVGGDWGMELAVFLRDAAGTAGGLVVDLVDDEGADALTPTVLGAAQVPPTLLAGGELTDVVALRDDHP